MRQVIAGVVGLALVGTAATAALVMWPVGQEPAKIELAGDVQRDAIRISRMAGRHSRVAPRLRLTLEPSIRQT